ncbi:pyridoxamine 5'-phosphate oxidase family protein [Mycobacterium sp. CBMA271]|uniref:pyridoxamine 5'-phosphate oxidase family protein n=1 Tax=unclassified Mycobacteroides TaxID=2618759 RepID=UPI0012DF98AC|nr:MULTISPECIES: pyridoxamine 5'-phosphate oxidase family protein [unclassified Mycobacteroides]MUM17256.1 pyridoxamine 5-phosphate oxidase [Mycobacteroides sp. CBMA 326]MUM23912.1 pyridoxamine 5'-phosphate oxidase family protein [Mycobacteroides sp. CBMA 271]
MTYHAGELAVQRRMGQSDSAIRVGRIISAEIPEVAAAFLAAQPMVFVSARDDDGRMWASQIIGPPGFAHATDARTIAIDGVPVHGDPLVEALRSERRVGMIALHPQRRRRMRVNGAAEPSGAGLIITTDQVYSNCPKYIARRDISGIGHGLPADPRRTNHLNTELQHAISSTDTFIIGTADQDGNADASHRGGNPGFLQALSPNTLRWPDYVGNSMFMTLGNLHVNPQCALLIPNWHTGSTVQLTGTARLNWDSGTFAPGAQCSVDFTVDEVVETINASPLRWGQAEPSPANPPL